MKSRIVTVGLRPGYYSGMKLSDLDTPCLVLDRTRLRRNIEAMNDRMEVHGVAFRPHVKTAKCLEVVRMIRAGKTGPITVSTLLEAEYFCADGFDDILYAVSIVPAKLPRVKKLLDSGCDLKLILDNADIALQVAAAGVELGVTFRVLIEIDCDGHRAGLAPDDPATAGLAKLLQAQAGVEFMGFMTHAGESYSCTSIDQIRQYAALEVKAIIESVGVVSAAAIDIPIRSVGSTPTATFAEDLQGISEVRAGVYVFQDLYQVGLGVCKREDIALSVLTTVISHKPGQNRLLVDAGGLALSKDHSTAAQTMDCGYGLVCEAQSGEVISGLVVDSANQEHGMITALDRQIDFARFPIGSQLRILPNHACMTAAAHDRYHVIAGDDTIRDRWFRCNGW